MSNYARIESSATNNIPLSPLALLSPNTNTKKNRQKAFSAMSSLPNFINENRSSQILNVANNLSGKQQYASKAYQCKGLYHNQDYSQKIFDPDSDRELAKTVAKEGALMLAGGWAIRGGVWAYRGIKVVQGSTEVFVSIKATQSLIAGTSIPKSFELIIGGGKTFWVHPNVTKHMAEYLSRNGLSHSTSTASQAMLNSFQQAVKFANTKGIEYGKMIKVGRWELMFNKSHSNDVLPVVYHALYK